MQSTRKPPFFPPPLPGEDYPARPSNVVPLRHLQREMLEGEGGTVDPDSAEPAWRRAFIVADGVKATRTPDRVIRARNCHPEQTAASEEPSVPDTMGLVDGTGEIIEEHPDPVVRAQLAQLRSKLSYEDTVTDRLATLAMREAALTESERAGSVSPRLLLERATHIPPLRPSMTERLAGASVAVARVRGDHSAISAKEVFMPFEASSATLSFNWPGDGCLRAQAPVSVVPKVAPLASQPPVEPVPAAADARTALSTTSILKSGWIPAEEDDVDLGYLTLYTGLVPETLGSRSEVIPALSETERANGAEVTPEVASVAIASDAEAGPVQAATANGADKTANEDHGRQLVPVPVPVTMRADDQGIVVDLPKTGPFTWGDSSELPSPAEEWTYQKPDIAFLAEPPTREGPEVTEDILEETAGRLEKVIRDFGVKGEVIHVHAGPVVTLYEFEPAPGVKSSRVIALSDDIARSMSAVSARVAVIPGRNAIGVELPNDARETVYLRELLSCEQFETSKHKLPLCLGKTIGGEPVIADLARMPHLLMAGTTGSGKSVAINTMILSLLYRFTPEQCRLIMVDPKMLELSVYDGIPHLLTPVVTDPKKAITALRWAVREMEDRYKKMAKLGVRNIDGFNARVAEAREKGEVITRSVQVGFDKENGQPVYTDEVMDLTSLPYIVVIVDEMADLMMVAGKEIEGAIQRLAQMARAAGIHVILATQRPSVDVITGTIKANFPTRVSFQVTSKIDSRTILGEMGAEQLLGQGDMLHMVGGGRIERVHGPFCSDIEVERVVTHLKRQAKPVYLEAVTADDEEEDETEETPIFDEGDMGLGSGDLYDQAVSIVLRHKKASTSYIQRRLQIGYNRAASIMERMEKEGVVGPANHAGKRDILIGTGGADED